MTFDEVKKILCGRKGEEIFKELFPQVACSYEYVILKSLFDIEQSMKSDEYSTPFCNTDYSNYTSLLRCIEDALFFKSLRQSDIAYIDAVLNLFGNWKRLKFSSDMTKIIAEINPIVEKAKMLISNSFMLYQLIDLNKILLHRIRRVLMNEPYDSNVSEMYLKNLEEYYSKKESKKYSLDDEN